MHGRHAQKRRDGCSECKRKKVKCDLKKPICSRCIRFPRQCKYSSDFINSAIGVCGSPIASIATQHERIRKPRPDALGPHFPPQISYVPSPHLSSSKLRFFMHHFRTQTCTVLFPFSPPSFKERLVSTAFETPHLLFSLLAASCSHHARLAYGTLSEAEKTTLEFTNLAVVGLRVAINDADELYSVETAMTAMTLCTNDICDGNLQSWRVHLTGVKELLSAFFKKQRNNARGSDPFAIFLAKWFATIDTSAGISGLDNNAVSDGQYWSINARQHNAGKVDDFCGYSLELMPILARLGTLARSQQHRSSVSSDEALTDISSGSGFNVWDEAQTIEAEILRLSHIPESEATNSPEKGCADGLRSTHQAFVYAALLYLHRRIQLLPKDHPTVREDITGILTAVEEIKPFLTANILVLWPLFSAGCDTDDLWERKFIQTRMDNMRTLGMGNFTRAKELMRLYWDSGTHLRWDIYFALSGTSLVLF